MLNFSSAAPNLLKTFGVIAEAGLPRVSGSPLAKRNPNAGATRGQPTKAKPYLDVAAQPSMKLVEARRGVQTRQRLNTKYAAHLDDKDYDGLRRILKAEQSDAERLSRGPLTLRRLTQMGHPYGRGRRSGLGRIQPFGGVSNRSVANKQSGEFARSWSTDLQSDDHGAMLVLSNDAEYAPFLAFGTSRMKAHGPFTTSPTRHSPAVMREWRRITRIAWQRENAARGDV